MTWEPRRHDSQDYVPGFIARRLEELKRTGEFQREFGFSFDSVNGRKGRLASEALGYGVTFKGTPSRLGKKHRG